MYKKQACSFCSSCCTTGVIPQIPKYCKFEVECVAFYWVIVQKEHNVLLVLAKHLHAFLCMLKAYSIALLVKRISPGTLVQLLSNCFRTVLLIKQC